MNMQLQGTFRALADPTRREILTLLSKRELTIAEVASQFDITRAAVKKHLVILEQGDLISVKSVGRQRLNRLEPLGLKPAQDWIGYFSQFWDERLSDLKNIIEIENNAHK